MKLSMWMIAGKMDKYSPKYDIKDGNAFITGVRFFSGGKIEFERQYVYLVINAYAIPGLCPPETAALVNGGDMIILQSANIDDILNDLLAVFDYYNSWETSLWRESEHKSFQRVLDLGDPVLGNPMMLSDADGNVLAMSGAYKNEDLNEYWVEARDTGHVPTVILGSPIQTRGGENVLTWSDEPAEYLTPDGINTIGVFLKAGGENAAGFCVWEHKRIINPGDKWLVKILCDVLTSIIGENKRGAELCSSSAVIADLLAGAKIDADLIGKMELKCGGPWRLVVIANPFRSDFFYTRSLVNKMRDVSVPCVPLICREKAVILVSCGDARRLVDSALGKHEKSYCSIAVSLPFDDMRDVCVRHEQALYALNRAAGEPGLRFVETAAFEYLMNMTGDINKKQKLAHPALTELKKYDTERHTELYDTLFYYLLNERSVLLGSRAVHVHRNTFIYRIRRIKSIIGVDLDDPEIRAYLLFSFYIEKS